MKVQNMLSSNGNKIANQIIIQLDCGGRLFQSYDSAIALIDKNSTVHLSEHWNYSTTTSKYRNIFLNETTKETRQKVEKGIYKLDLSLNGELL